MTGKLGSLWEGWQCSIFDLSDSYTLKKFIINMWIYVILTFHYICYISHNKTILKNTKQDFNNLRIGPKEKQLRRNVS